MIDNSELDASLHNSDISFFLTRLDHHSIYTMLEIDHLEFPISIEKQPSLDSLLNLMSSGDSVDQPRNLNLSMLDKPMYLI